MSEWKVSENILHKTALIMNKVSRNVFNPLSVNITKWSITLKQFVGRLPIKGLKPNRTSTMELLCDKK